MARPLTSIVRPKELPEAVRLLLWQHLPSIDHGAILLALRAAPTPLAVTAMAERVQVDGALIVPVLEQLVDAGLAERAVLDDVAGFRYAARAELDDAVHQLQIMYDTRPVTLVRAIYDRPSSVAQLFADAFRIRPREES